jgi:ribosome biogenesis GTPase
MSGGASLAALGWGPAEARNLASLGRPDWQPMRVVTAERGAWRVSDGDAEAQASLAGRLRQRPPAEVPVVGDWVAVERGEGEGEGAVIVAVLPRATELRRGDPDPARDQVLVANVDLALLLMGLDGDFNPRRLERYVALAGGAGIRPLLVLTKADLCDPAMRDERAAAAAAVAPGVTVLVTTLIAPDGARPVERELRAGETAVLLGSSGVGKSTLLNALVGGDVQRTQAVRRHDSRGRHTTTRRELFRLPGGALVIDTPGLRELRLADAGGGLDQAFADLVELAARCRFRDCKHREEPDCAVRAAVASGQVAPERLAAWHKLAAEPRPGDRRRRR